jgi:hypothetical protein
MKGLSLSIAATALLALSNVAGAAEPMTLTDTQLDNVSAGRTAFASINVFQSGNGDTYVSGNLGTIPGFSANASVYTSTYPYGYVEVSSSATAYVFR